MLAQSISQGKIKTTYSSPQSISSHQQVSSCQCADGDMDDEPLATWISRSVNAISSRTSLVRLAGFSP